MVISPAVSPRSLTPVNSSSASDSSSLRSFDLEEAKEDGLFRNPFDSHSPILNHPYIHHRQHNPFSSWQHNRRTAELACDRGRSSREKGDSRSRRRRHHPDLSLTALSAASGVGRGRRRSIRRWITPCSLVGNVVMFVLVLYMLANPCSFSGRKCSYERREQSGLVEQQQQPQEQDGGLKLLSEVKGVVPEFKLEKVTFTNDSRYANEQMFKNKDEHQKILDQWEADVPLGRGFVSIPNDSISHLQTPFHINSNPTLNGYSIASFHQYHCLWMIMRGYGRAVFPSSTPTNSHKLLLDEAEATRHVTHCFDYLRQSVLCAGDSALEGKSEQLAGMTDGWGTEHVCRSVEAQKKWIVDNRLSNNRGIH